MSIDEIKLRYDFINKELNELQSELKSISVTSFELNPHIMELTNKIQDLNNERIELLKRIENESLED